MTITVPFKQIDVFTAVPFKGNPVAVVNFLETPEAEVTTQQLQSIAKWTNLSETTFLFAPSNKEYNYKLRIFTPAAELPFAGHPTIGSCRAYLEFTNQLNSGPQTILQECGVGIVPLKFDEEGKISFQAKKTEVEEISRETASDYAKALGIHAIEPPKLLQVGPAWVVYLVSNAEAVIDLNPDFNFLKQVSDKAGHTGVILAGSKNDGNSGEQYEMRAFYCPTISVLEDPVCGSGCVALLRYLQEIKNYQKTTLVNVTQGIRLCRDGHLRGRIEIDEKTSQISYHVGGDAVTVINGQISI
ncbi:Yhi9p NDAI_0D01630 [Naumovozyma dairenensis CBS 421]|uniref:Phenazine biosynthesis protein n=1 Tax=Naumovozyma dairenensis (strain ATCC 10597 / BCRC 20456 / CBS 421 / NBRC 0211 / NRRL Y-12639) TaxID=1071378 RepID=G0W9L6_NAUDC|nr:hypothetical protein NDAI_0D01630 [Naumovozyma dairenensis CBS 421]CCD24477.1 hypothetical protein NDAI_0D01630 [Naumovozyma dairenensis CBS 421]